MLVIPFLMFVLRRFRRVLFTGFNGGESWSLSLSQAPILSHFGQANNPRRLGASDDESTYFAFAFHDDLHVEESCWIQVSFTSFPLQGLRVSRYPGEGAIPHSQRVGDWRLPHPTSNIKLSKYKLCHVSSMLPRFHVNGSHAMGWPRTHRYLVLYSPPTEPFRAKSAHVAIGKWWGLLQSLGLLQAPVFKPGSMTLHKFLLHLGIVHGDQRNFRMLP